MKIRRIRGQRVLLDPVDVIVKQADRLIALIDDLDPRRLAEWHPPVTVIGIAILDDDRQADDLSALAEAIGEKIADGCLDSGPITAIPVDPQQHFLVVGSTLGCPSLWLRPEKGEPDVSDHSGAFLIHQLVGCSRCDLEIIPVACLFQIALWIGGGIEFALSPAAADLADPHGGRDAHRASLLRFGEVFKRVGPSASSHPGGQRENDRQRFHDGSRVAIGVKRGEIGYLNSVSAFTSSSSLIQIFR